MSLGGRLSLAAVATLWLAACQPGEPRPAKPVPPPADTPNAAGLVRLPCDKDGAIRPALQHYCKKDRNFVTPTARQAMHDAARKLAAQFPGVAITYTEASWPSGVRPMPPHLSHGDGRQVDISVFYQSLDGKPLAAPEHGWNGFGAFEPPRRESERMKCPPGSNHAKGEDPPTDRKWRLDEARTRALLKIFVEDQRVRRVLLEPHLKTRFGYAGHPKIRFAGCNAARHDDHLHVDFY